MFEARSVNPPHGDPAVCVRFAGSTPAPDGLLYLFDCGSLLALPHSDLLKIRRVFISHTHIDHAIGLDHLIRIQLYNKIPLEIYGPAGLIEQFSGRLRGYAWNLIGDSPYIIELHEILTNHVISRQLRCSDQFRPGRIRRRRHQGELVLSEGCTLQWIPVEHGVPCLGYRLTGQPFYRFLASSARSLELAPGPWVSRLKDLALRGVTQKMLEIQGHKKTVSEWSALLLLKEPAPSMVYITDTLLSRPLITRFASFASGCDQLWCEATYIEEDSEKAAANLHATASQAAWLAREAEAGELRLFHFSRRYQGQTEVQLAEARAVFPQSFLGETWP